MKWNELNKEKENNGEKSLKPKANSLKTSKLETHLTRLTKKERKQIQKWNRDHYYQPHKNGKD